MEMQDRVRIQAAAAANKEPPPVNPARQTKLENGKKLLEGLIENQKKLEDDYRCKVASLKIDESCRNLIAARVDPRTDKMKAKIAKAKTMRPLSPGSPKSARGPTSPTSDSMPPA